MNLYWKTIYLHIALNEYILRIYAVSFLTMFMMPSIWVPVLVSVKKISKF